MQQKDDLVFLANRLTIAGLGFLALAMTGAIMLITDVLFGAGRDGGHRRRCALTMFVVFWDVLPLRGAVSLGRRRLLPDDPPREPLSWSSRLVGEAAHGGALGGVGAQHLEVLLPDARSSRRAATLSSSSTCSPCSCVGVAQHLHVGQLVGGVDRHRLVAGRLDPVAMLALALLVGLDRFVVGQRVDQLGDPLAAALAHVVEPRARCPRRRRAGAPPPAPRRRRRARRDARRPRPGGRCRDGRRSRCGSARRAPRAPSPARRGPAPSARRRRRSADAVDIWAPA